MEKKEDRTVRTIEMLIVHVDDNDSPKWGIPELKISHELRGFGGIGYHYWINFVGNLYNTRSLEIPGCHVQGKNKNSIGICLHGRHTFSIEQFETLKVLLRDLCERYKLGYDAIYPHNKFNAGKTCPNFDLQSIVNELKGESDGR